MSRDSLEGVRPPDSFDPADMRPHDALDRPAVAPQAGVVSPGRSFRAIVTIAIAILGVIAGVLMFVLTNKSSSSAPRSAPSPQSAPSTRPTATPSDQPTGDVVRQVAPPTEPSPASATDK